MIKIVIPEDRIEKKYYAWIWIALIIVSLFQNAVSIYYEILAIGDVNAGEIIIRVLFAIINYGLLPTALCALIGMMFNNMLYRRGIVMCSRNDFVYWAMIFTGTAKFLIGFINCFGILNDTLVVYSFMFVDELLVTVFVYLMGTVFMHSYYGASYKKIYYALQTLAPVYWTFLGIFMLSGPISSLIVSSDANMTETFLELISMSFGTDVELNGHSMYASITAICLFVVMLIAHFLIAHALKLKAAKCTDDEDDTIHFDGPGSDGSPFDEYGNNNHDDENVFDEFDM